MFGLKAFKEQSFLEAFKMLRERFAECKVAYETIKERRRNRRDYSGNSLDDCGDECCAPSGWNACDDAACACLVFEFLS